MQTVYRLFLSVLFTSSFNLMWGQIERTDFIDNGSMNSSFVQLDTCRQNKDIIRRDSLCNYDGIYPLTLNSAMVEFYLNLRICVPYNIYHESGQNNLFKWHNGEIAISGQSTPYPGMMQVDTGSIWTTQSIGNFRVCVGAIANKYGWYNGLKTQYGLAGTIEYQISPKLSFRIYGRYYFGANPRLINGMYLPPSMLGYYDYTKIGGYLNYNANNRFGIQLGGQIVKRTYNNIYEVEPIATPYIKVGKGKKKIGIGLPVGQILNGLFNR